MPELVSVMKLAGPPKPAVNPPIVRGRQPLPNADPLIIQRSLSSKSAREQGFLEGARYDSNYEAIANAFARQGKLALARDWAAMAVVQDASANGPATIFTAWLAEGHAESQQRRGWTELAGGNPIMADALFSIPVDAELRPADPSSREEKTSFDWTRVIGAFQGRMMARQALGDLEGAKADARAFVAYTQRALQRQSFTRFETRDLVARFARPALLVAVQTLVGPSGRLERQTSPQDFNTIFEALQLMKPSSTGATVTRLAARLSQRSTDLAVAARSREELRLRWDAARLDAIREASDKKAALVRSLGQELSEMDRRIAVAYPAYVNLTGTTAVTVDRTIDALGKDQVLIAYAFASRDAYLVALSAVGGRIVRLDKSLEEIRKVALAVRQSIEPQAGQFVRFRNEDASRLSELALRPVWDLVATPANRILVTVPDGPIDGLPLSILPAPGEPASFVIDKVATSRLPSISSLVLLRTFGAPPAGQQQPFIGIGDPILEGNPAQRRGLSVGDVSADRKVIDVRKLRALPRLPETADEITRLAKLFGSGSDAIVLGAAATEAKIRALPFASFRTIAFATHGLVAGELSSFNEPGLVLTPPAQPSGDDDGFLSASEISALDLRADLVLLSACNTASTDGKEGTDGLSGLAKAFFFAGARNLLVSHWSVESSAATHLTTAMIQSRQAGSAPTYAEALRSAIVSLKAKSTRQAAHPGFWGAFEVIGN
jgi:CHAT domain-containing protein